MTKSAQSRRARRSRALSRAACATATTNKPAAAVDVGSVPPGTPHNRPDQFRAIVTSGPRGEFSFDCPEADGHDRFFALEGPWGGCLALTRIALPSSPGKHQRTLYSSGAVMDAISFREGDPMNPCGT